MLDLLQFKDYVIKPALETISKNIPYSENAVYLLLGTALQESGLRAFRQYGNGPALGLLQLEPATHQDIWENYLIYRESLTSSILSLVPPSYLTGTAKRPMPGTPRPGEEEIVLQIPQPDCVISFLFYAVIMARIQYRRSPMAIPDKEDIRGLARIWKQAYNTHKGKGVEIEFEEKYFNHIYPLIMV